MILRFLLGVDDSSEHLNAQNKDGRSALIVAVDANKIEVVRELLHHEHIDTGLKDTWGMTAVDIGNVRRQTELVQLLGGTMKVRKPPALVKIKGRSRTFKEKKVTSGPPVNPTYLDEAKATEFLGARPKTNQQRKLSNSLDSLLICSAPPNKEQDDGHMEVVKTNTSGARKDDFYPSNSTNTFHEATVLQRADGETELEHNQNHVAIEQQNGFHEDSSLEENDFDNLDDVMEMESKIWEHDDALDGDLSTTHINNDLVEEVRKNIIAKIDEYNDKISEEESSFMAMKDLLLKKKKVQTVLMTEINKEKKEFHEKIRREKEMFEKKQENEMNTFFEHIRLSRCEVCNKI